MESKANYGMTLDNSSAGVNMPMSQGMSAAQGPMAGIDVAPQKVMYICGGKCICCCLKFILVNRLWKEERAHHWLKPRDQMQALLLPHFLQGQAKSSPPVRSKMTHK